MTNTDKILKTLSYKYAKGGLTASEIAAKAGLKTSSTRTTLYELRSAGTVSRVGTTAASGRRGRPSYLYVL